MQEWQIVVAYLEEISKPIELLFFFLGSFWLAGGPLEGVAHSIPVYSPRTTLQDCKSLSFNR